MIRTKNWIALMLAMGFICSSPLLSTHHLFAQDAPASLETEAAPPDVEPDLWDTKPEASETEGNDASDMEDQEEGLWGLSPEDQTPAVSGNVVNGDLDGAASPAIGEGQRVQELEDELKQLREQVQSLLDAEDVRGELEESDVEKEQKEEDILNAAGTNYVLMKKGRIGVEYQLSYSYYDFDTISEINVIEHNSNHNLTNTFTVEYPLKDNLTIEASIPFVYEYDEVGSDDSKNVSDFGDVDFGMSFQPIKSGGKIPSMIVNTTLTCPMGRNPYEINPDTEVSTGSGGYSVGTSLSFSKAIDPIMAYGTLSYTYRHPIKNLNYKIGSSTLERYDRGDSIGFSFGLGYSISYMTSVTFGYSYSHSLSSERYYKETTEPISYKTTTSSSLSLGSSWRISPKMRVNLSLAMGLGNSDYYTLSLRFPFEFTL